MITAERARERALANSAISIKNANNKIQQAINSAVENGLFTVNENTNLRLSEIQQLQDEYIRAGYVCTVEKIMYFHCYDDARTSIKLSWY